MVKVLVFGGAGYIGSATCLALRQAGHTVVGVSRQKSVAELEQNEVEVAQGDINDLKTLQSKIDEANVVIDNVLDSTKGFNANKDLLAAVEASAKKNGRKRYIYTSGCLVYGDNKGKILSETDALKQPMLKARTDHEQATCKSADVDGVVVRPGFVYGGKSSEMSGWMVPNSQGQWVIDGSPDKSWSWIHIQDLARLYVNVVEAATAVVRGEIFNAADSTRVTFGEFRTALARAAGFKGDMIFKSEVGKDFFSQLCEASTVISSQKASKLLGWVPNVGPLQDNYETVYRAWKANQKK